MKKSKFHRTFQGYGIAPGIAIGQAAIVEVGHFPRDIPRYAIAARDVKREIQRFRMAVEAARSDVDALVKRVAVHRQTWREKATKWVPPTRPRASTIG